MALQTVQIPAYRPFTATVVGLRRLTPTFLRITFAGPDLDRFTSWGPDQRIKVLLPVPGRGLVDCPTGPDWYAEWRSLPADRRLPLRTYTVRAVRRDPPEVDVDFVLHGATGPASAWAEDARVGDEIVLVGPNALFEGPGSGFEWRPPSDAGSLLIAGDETAVPAISAIVESLPAECRGRVLLEVPVADDALDIAAPDALAVTWLPRRQAAGTSPRGLLLTRAVMAAASELAADRAIDGAIDGAIAPTPVRPEGRPDLDEPDGDDLLWDVPAEPGRSAGGYAWLAGEAGVVTGLRRLLVRELGVPRASVAFMGYWREGTAGG